MQDRVSVGVQKAMNHSRELSPSSLVFIDTQCWNRRRKWQPTPVFLPGESCGQRSLVGCHLWGCTVRHDWSDLACMHALEKEMATHSSILAWRIPGTGKPGGLPSTGSHRVRHDWSDLAAARHWINAGQRVQPKSNYYAIFVMYQKTKSGNSPKMEKLLSLFPSIQEKY